MSTAKHTELVRQYAMAFDSMHAARRELRRYIRDYRGESNATHLCEQQGEGGGPCRAGRWALEDGVTVVFLGEAGPSEQWCEYCRGKQPLYLTLREAEREMVNVRRRLLAVGRRLRSVPT